MSFYLSLVLQTCIVQCIDQNMLFEKRLLGTPSEEQWPGVSDLRDWHEFPQWKPQSLARVVPTLEPEGVDLLSVSSKSDYMLIYCVLLN